VIRSIFTTTKEIVKLKKYSEKFVRVTAKNLKLRENIHGLRFSLIKQLKVFKVFFEVTQNM
jgi:hypothetical protein